MQKQPSIPEKPVSDLWRPELTRLPTRNPAMRLTRWFVRGLARILVFFWIRLEVHGAENYPQQGPALLALNHLGDADAVVILAVLTPMPDFIGKIELYDLPLLGALMDAMGVIWVHRGRPDRRALKAALDGLALGRIIGLAPEARESLSGVLEFATEGAAFLALKAGAPIVPVTLTGTENDRLYGNMKRLRRTAVSLTVGRPFRLPGGIDRPTATRLIMETLARQLPPEYRGVYGYVG
ncbi:MAG: 1-acyl-sn-glycerol-3-phosphate acyltransferase [Chloroflexi bacterium]|nr:1-acyl-sn-glycerol-3-phosphate acyltransferase [Chloroflexota bacterium]